MKSGLTESRRTVVRFERQENGGCELLSKTLASGLSQYEIGPKVRALRLMKKLGLVQLGEHTGLSPAMISKIERGQLFPTLPTLFRIALVFGVGLEHFFIDGTDRRQIAVVRKADRVRLPDRPGAEPPSYYFESLNFPVSDRTMEAFYAEFPADSLQSEPHRHDGPEFIYVVKGRLVLSIDGEDMVLDQGDATYFDPTVPHSYRAEGRGLCAAIVVVAQAG